MSNQGAAVCRHTEGTPRATATGPPRPLHQLLPAFFMRHSEKVGVHVPGDCRQSTKEHLHNLVLFGSSEWPSRYNVCQGN